MKWTVMGLHKLPWLFFQSFSLTNLLLTKQDKVHYWVKGLQKRQRKLLKIIRGFFFYWGWNVCKKKLLLLYMSGYINFHQPYCLSRLDSIGQLLISPLKMWTISPVYLVYVWKAWSVISCHFTEKSIIHGRCYHISYNRDVCAHFDGSYMI